MLFAQDMYRRMQWRRVTSHTRKIPTACHTNRCLQFHKRSQLFIRTHNEPLSVVALGGFLEGSALGPFVKVDPMTRERFRITRNTSWRTILVRAHDFGQCSL